MTQEREQNVVWPHDLQDDAMVAGIGDDDFTKFLDLDSDFQQFTQMNNGHSGLDTPMGQLGFGNNSNDLSYGNAEQMHMNMPPGTESMSYQNHLANQPYGQYHQQYQQMQMPQQYHVPPTPVSADMQAAKYAHHMGNNGQILFDHQQVSFTPLVSPAQTPLDNVFAINDFGLGDDFFSPLTSPAIEAQGPFTGTTASPVDLNADQGAHVPSQTTGTKRPRRKATNTTRTPARSVKQSPAMKPHHRSRHPSLSSLSLDKISSMLPQSAHPSSLYPSAPNSAIIQPSDDSVSPEALSEAAMRPPPVPHSAKSPQPHATAQNSNNPVTPAILMRMPSKQSVSVKQLEQHASAHVADGPLEDIMLPDAADSDGQPIASASDIGKMGDDSESTPTLSAKSAKLTASSTPRSALTRMDSSETFAKPGKLEFRGNRAGKKRQSTSSATISPALRPKISPSISPLVPVTGPGMAHLSAETSALYLASKSNYQNILEGTHLPGVSYPETLAENLTSKRTSHKIAEQGRRNRINLALKEIETLLPQSILASQGKKDRSESQEAGEAESKSSAAAAQGTSKASTVEMAIIYIKSLQAELKETKDKLDAAEKRLAEGSSSSDSLSSDG
ncbi:hypothetical protein LTR99_000638 [Exophiala xenobiotica]|uniref:BHLH domain-containing protein n=1 Tax=Vermiconidia calcicola TaxID=1690605 RepID=A0AAV9QGQ1_9PEZI|nr:hypothetical protein LTR92_002945 [Exophiala xenobiotica]KAK5543539.1 hypothetical protein LTR25_001153 [Vermiconidia calcicola]KAK5548202.1 hypothetical protein LTR23_001911 [Chaetothyriales sp. CCFEE 6169]KAK5213377.1 hypothetical protein LTR41_000956 [Exophiala xenobiotica]KAK5231054.1 hypothetical protein LTR72_000234 [Exophiala xenobiotica]